jgi:hypothetical protein
LFDDNNGEAVQDRIVLKDGSAAAFELLLQYMYAGSIHLMHNAKVEQRVELIKLAEKYGLGKLAKGIIKQLEVLCIYTYNVCSDELIWNSSLFDHQAIMNGNEVCKVLLLAYPNHHNLIQCCLRAADRMANEVVNSASFQHLPSEVVIMLLSRDTFNTDGLHIFTAVDRWIKKVN